MVIGKHIDDLGSMALSWRDLLVVTRQSPPQHSALSRSQSPNDWMWGLGEMLAASTVDELRWLHWAKTENAGKATNPAPEPIIRPGVEAPNKAADMRVGDAMTREEFDRRHAARLAAAS